jgi:hypothetical protein
MISGHPHDLQEKMAIHAYLIRLPAHFIVNLSTRRANMATSVAHE